jgi:hypothetical protein
MNEGVRDQAHLVGMSKQKGWRMAREEEPQREQTQTQRRREDHDERTMPGEPTSG